MEDLVVVFTDSMRTLSDVTIRTWTKCDNSFFFLQNNVTVMTPNVCIFTGEIRSWFVNIPEISQSENSRLRFVMTRANFCVLDSSYNIYHDYKFRMVKCEVSFDIETDMVELKVYTDDGVYQTSKAYKLFYYFFQN